MQHGQKGSGATACHLAGRQKSVGVTEARPPCAAVMEGVQHNGDIIMLMKHGQPAAVMVSIGWFEQWKKERNALFDVFARVQAKNADSDISEDELMAFLEKAKHAIRSQSPKK